MIASEVIFFANLIIGYLYLRVRAGQWPPEGIEPLELLLPTINTAILLSSALPMHGAHLAIRRGDRQGMKIGLILASILGLIFIGGQAWEYTHAPFSLKSGTLGSTFFTLTGFHGLHVMVGIILMMVCYVRALLGQFHPLAPFRGRSGGDVLAFRGRGLGDPLRRALSALTRAIHPAAPSRAFSTPALRRLLSALRGERICTSGNNCRTRPTRA